MTPYSVEDIVSSKVKINAKEYFKAWGYTNLDIIMYEQWERRKLR